MARVATMFRERAWPPVIVAAMVLFAPTVVWAAVSPAVPFLGFGSPVSGAGFAFLGLVVVYGSSSTVLRLVVLVPSALAVLLGVTMILGAARPITRTLTVVRTH